MAVGEKNAAKTNRVCLVIKREFPFNYVKGEKGGARCALSLRYNVPFEIGCEHVSTSQLDASQSCTFRLMQTS